MKTVTVVRVNKEGLMFSDGTELVSVHDSACCEYHYLCFADLALDDFEGFEFDLTSDFFERVPGYGIVLKSVNGFDLSVPGYGRNYGHYTDNLRLELRSGSGVERFDITDCQYVDPG